MRRVIRLIIVATAAATLPGPPAAHGGDGDPSPPLRLSVHLGESVAQYGSTVGLKVRIHNPGKQPVTLFHDGRLDGALRVVLLDARGLLWRPEPATVPAPKRLRVVTEGIRLHAIPVTTASIKAGKHLDLRFTLKNFELVNGPRADRSIQWYEVLPPGRYRVRVVYEQRDSGVRADPPAVQNSHPRETTSGARTQSAQGNWTGRLQGEATLIVTAPRRADVDALRKRIKVLEATNRGLQKKLDAIRAVVGGA